MINDLSEKMKDLRQKAEFIINEKKEIKENISNQDLSKIIHDLSVYQIELELQNEELRNTQKELEQTRNNYIDLFNQAPNGYITLSDIGQIIQVNSTFSEMIGIEASTLILKNFTDYIVEEDKPEFLGRFKAFFKNPEGKSIEIGLNKANSEPIFVSISGRIVVQQNLNNIENKPSILLSIIDITERKQAEESLKESQRKLATLMNNLPGLAYRCLNDMDWTMILMSDGCFQLTGFYEQELEGNQLNNYGKLIHQDDAEMVWQKVQDAIKNHTFWQIEYRIHTKDGTEKWVWEQGCGVYSSKGDLDVLEGFIIDITERKKAEEELLEQNHQLESQYEEFMQLNEELRVTNYDLEIAKSKAEENEEKYRLQFLNMSSYNSMYEVVTDKEGKPCDFRFIMVNHAYEDYVGKMANELIGKTLLEVYPKTEQFWIEKMAEVAITGEPSFFENYSSVMNTHTEINLYVPQPGQLAMTTANIKQRKQAEEKLRESETRLKLAASSGGLGIWDWNVKDNVMVWDDRMFELYGVKHDTFPNNIDAWLNGLHPEDKQRAIDESNSALNGDKEFNTTFRVLHPDGTVLHIKANGLVIKDNENKPLRMIGINSDITERKQAEEKLLEQNQQLETQYEEYMQLNEELRVTNYDLEIAKSKAEENEEKYRLLFQNLNTGFALHEIILNDEDKPYDYRFLEINSAFENLTGLKANDLIGKTHLEVMPNSEPYWSETYGKVALAGVSINFENFSSELNKYYQVNAYSPEPGKFATIFLDITDRKKAEKLLLEQNQQLEAQYEEYMQLNEVLRVTNYNLEIAKEKAEENEIYLQSFLSIIDDIIVTRDLNDNVVYFNTAFDNVTKYLFNQPALKGINTLELLPKEAREFWENILLEVKNGSNNSYEYEFKSNDSKTNYYITSHIPIIKSSKIIGTLEISKDITFFKQREIELQKAKEKAEESDKLKTAFLQNMSHEIRTPLNGILGFSNLLQDDNIEKEDIKEYTTVIQQSGNRLLEIVNNVLDISKIETGQVTIIKKAFLINSIFTDLLTFFTPFADTKNIKLCHDNLDDTKRIIYSDESKLSQILTNLINNSLKFTNSGRIDYGYEIIENDIQFYVKDTGTGISSEYYKKIFDRFTQVDLKITRGYEGAGLGLAICKGLVELLGGKIWLESSVGNGTTFFFTIPLIEETFDSIFEKAEIDLPIKLQKGKILIAEDDWTSFQYLSKLLAKTEIIILHADNGEKAVEYVKTIPDISLVLMDIKMPILNGIEATKLIKQIRPELPIIAQTAYAFSSERDEILSIGCNDYISKPISKPNLLKLIEKYG